jgi:MoaA/NifB/PqqE/SkfB family radical SAM enzyme
MFAYPDFVKQAEGLRNLSFITELYGSTPRLHDSITCAEGSYEQSLKGMHNLVARFPVELRMVISRPNLKDTPLLAELYAEEFPAARRFVIFPIDLIGNAARNREQVAVRYRELVPYVQQAVDRVKDRIPVYLFHIPYCVLDPAYHDYVKGVTVLEHRVALTDVCRGCRFEEECPRVWVSYIKHFGADEFCRVENKKLK